MYNTLVCVLIFMAVGMATASPIIAASVSVTLFALSFIPREHSYGFHNELLKTIVQTELVRNIYPENTFYQGARVDTEMDGNIVKTAQSGTPPKSYKNVEQRPLPITVTKDDFTQYDIDVYETAVELITSVNALLTPYDKPSEKLLDHIETLNTRIADEIAIKWYPTAVATNVIRTTGTNNKGTKVTGMTGNRNEVTQADLIEARAIADRMGMPEEGRRMYVYSEQFTREIAPIPAYKDYDKTGVVGLAFNGSAGKVEGFEVFKRNVPLLGASAGNKKVYGAAVGATDCLAILIYHPKFVRYAKDSSPKIIADSEERPGMGGLTFQAKIRGGASPVRKDERGIIVILQQ